MEATNTTEEDIKVVEENVARQETSYQELKSQNQIISQNLSQIAAEAVYVDTTLKNLTMMYSKVVVLSKDFLRKNTNTNSSIDIQNIMTNLESTLGDIQDNKIKESKLNINTLHNSQYV